MGRYIAADVTRLGKLLAELVAVQEYKLLSQVCAHHDISLLETTHRLSDDAMSKGIVAHVLLLASNNQGGLGSILILFQGHVQPVDVVGVLWHPILLSN